jgi:hypothetical protein
LFVWKEWRVKWVMTNRENVKMEDVRVPLIIPGPTGNSPRLFGWVVVWGSRASAARVAAWHAEKGRGRPGRSAVGAGQRDDWRSWRW